MYSSLAQWHSLIQAIVTENELWRSGSDIPIFQPIYQPCISSARTWSLSLLIQTSTTCSGKIKTWSEIAILQYTNLWMWHAAKIGFDQCSTLFLKLQHLNHMPTEHTLKHKTYVIFSSKQFRANQIQYFKGFIRSILSRKDMK